MSVLERACSPNGKIFNNYKVLAKNPSWKIPLLDSKVQIMNGNEIKLKKAECDDMCKHIHS
jgi:hypothetical protein